MSEEERKARQDLVDANRELRDARVRDFDAQDQVDAYRKKRERYNKATRVLIAIICKENP